MARAPLVGIFVGGKSTRMGGVPKGLLPAPEGGTLIARLLRIAERAISESYPEESASDPPIVLVGNAGAYSAIDVAALVDTPAGIGPLGGLAALLSRSSVEGRSAALALSCDLPFLTHGLVLRLLNEQAGALALAPRVETFWSPLTARYSVRALPAVEAAIAAGEHALQRLFARFGEGCRELVIDENERSVLLDWDSPEDIEALALERTR